MKKIISLLLAMLAAFSLIACGKSDTQGNPKDSGTMEGQTEEQTVKEPYPADWYSCPMALFSFFDEHDLSGKQVYLFCSHGTGGLASSVKDISAAIPEAKISDHVFDVYEEGAASAKDEIVEWIKSTSTN